MRKKRLLTPIERQRIPILIPFARLGLLGCNCHASGKPMPCKHVLRDCCDPAIVLILTALKRTRDLHSATVSAARSLAEHPDYAAKYASSKPIFPTDAEPSSLVKQGVLRRRVEAKQEIRHPLDKTWPFRQFKRFRFGKPLYRKKFYDRAIKPIVIEEKAKA